MKSLFFCATFLFLATLVCFSLGDNDNPHVKISDGELKGKFLKSRDGTIYSAFLGIPYAKPPKRFQLAESPESWTGVRDATKFGGQCWQRIMFIGKGAFGNEDCLFANVYVPGKMTTKDSLPVMVHIHGGAFITGSADTLGANFLMDHDVILVTLNYRLGPLGFLSTGNDGVIEGNLGLKDQLFALKWVQRNIKAFGGDPKRVTIFGISAGSASVHYLAISNLSKDLFQQAIMHSGTAISPWAYTDNPAKNAFELGNSMGCNTDSSEQLLECLKGKSAEELTAFEKPEWYMDPLVLFPPVKDAPNSKQVLIPESPMKLMESGNFNKIPILITMCKDEGLFLHSAVVSRTESLRKDINEDSLRVLPITLYYSDIGLSQSQKNFISNRVKNFYFSEKYIGEETLANLTNMYSDRWFIHNHQTTAQLHAKHSTVYNAVLSYQGEHSILAFLGIKERLGVSHGDDAMYLFNGDYSPKLTPNSKDEEMSKLYVSALTQFAKTGKPEFKELKWLPFSTSRPTWFNINFPPEVLENPFKERIEFWDKIWGEAKKDEL